MQFDVKHKDSNSDKIKTGYKQRRIKSNSVLTVRWESEL